MSIVRIHNISDRANTPSETHAIWVGTVKLMPGKFTEMERSSIGKKLLALHGKTLWIGELSEQLKSTSRSALRIEADESGVPEMDLQEVRQKLETMSMAQLIALCDQMTPALQFSKPPPQPMLVARLARTLFSDDRVLDPSAFFWLRRWTYDGDNYVEKDV